MIQSSQSPELTWAMRPNGELLDAYSLICEGIGHHTSGDRVPVGYADKAKDFGIGGEVSGMDSPNSLVEMGGKYCKRNSEISSLNRF